MRIAVAYQDGQIGEHFGHAELFAVYEYENADVNRCTKRLIETGDLHGHQAMADAPAAPAGTATAHPAAAEKRITPCHKGSTDSLFPRCLFSRPIRMAVCRNGDIL